MSNKYTPIKDRLTNKPILLGDKVKNEKGYFGILSWDDCFNRYIIKSESGGNIKATSYIKVSNLKKNNIDTTRVECRANHLKKKW